MLAALLEANVFAYLLVFVRLGAAFMLLPTLGEAYIPARLRLSLALAVALVALPGVAPDLPPLPLSLLSLGLLVGAEAVIGIFLGTVARIMMSALAVAGMVAANSMSIATALVNDPTAAEQGSILSNFLTITALMLVFALDLHHLLLRAVVESYRLFPPGLAPPMGDLAEAVTLTVAGSFLIGFKIATPFIAAAGLFYLGLGVLARLMPQMQVFFIAIPLHIALGLAVLALALPVMLRVFLEAFEGGLGRLLVP